ncbi:aconitate hydratase AcnA [Oceanispirochaeta crateris]|uniref:Aconitate hydratase n=1 Tax=Oceanispirochaeta crateris TaxID=2518645 RepID=A0A5C1QGR6_9SPIO|nr:aconitate hydratase AcnA [Oceanispirochaeta crateris]QEN06498.1 aconitate hydratase AcnA [Oceanispirochaeta crateris]
MLKKELDFADRKVMYYSLQEFAREKGFDLAPLPVAVKILMENMLRHGSSDFVSPDDLSALSEWNQTKGKVAKDINFHPGRVVMQDFTGVPAVVDLAAMRNALSENGGDASKINPVIPVDMVVDHSVQVDFNASPSAYKMNVKKEFERNSERYRLLNWAQKEFKNFRVVPPGTGIVHQVNLEYLADVVTLRTVDGQETAFPDTLVGTDSHTTMIGGLCVLGWGVGGIEAEAALLGQPLTMLIPEVVGFRFTGKLPEGTTATDLVLTVTQMLRARAVVGKFVEFYGPGLDHLSLADRATISNMAPEYGATCGLFPIDDELLKYLRLTGRDEQRIRLVEEYAKLQGLWRDPKVEPEFSDTLSLDLREVKPSMAGPNKPQNRVVLEDITSKFEKVLKADYGVSDLEARSSVEGTDYSLGHGDVAIAAITSCTNTSNPAILIAAGLLAKKAVKAGLRSKPWVKTSFAPGSQVVISYLEKAGLLPYLEKLGFHLVGFGCTTCIGNSGPLRPEIEKAILAKKLVTVNVLSGNRNFAGRIHPVSQASFLASPPLVVAYALAGSLRIDITRDALAVNDQGEKVYFKDLWPENSEIEEVMAMSVSSDQFKDKYAEVFKGTAEWAELSGTSGSLFAWTENSSYIRRPPFFDKFNEEQKFVDIKGARTLAILPDATTTDHISPAGVIPFDEPAGQYLISQGVSSSDFNSFGSRRGNHEVMMRGTFGNIRLKNKMLNGVEGGYTLNSRGEQSTIFDTSMAYQKKGIPLILFAGKEYGAGSSRDWAAKGTLLLGVKAVIAESYERIHRSNLVGMGILPLEFEGGDSVDSLGIKGMGSYDLLGVSRLSPKCHLTLVVNEGRRRREFQVRVRIDTSGELDYYRAGGILNLVLKHMSQ